MDIIFPRTVLDHDTGPAHPENARRLLAFSGPEFAARPLPPEPALPDGAEFLELVHPKAYVEHVRRHAAEARPLDGDTKTSAGSFQAATDAVGAAVLAMQRGDFALVRPPGHHAYRDEAHGFCLFNNVAVAAQKAVKEGQKVLILDFDGHLGDGTMDIFYRSNQVLYWSLHQFPAYPGNGAAHEIGEGKGRGYTINIPLPAGAGDDIFRHAIEYCWPVVEQFRPDVVAVSAGFDAHQFDPLLQLRATGNFYFFIGKMLAEAFPGRLFAVLEGGYNTEELPRCVHNFIAGVNGAALPFPETPTASGMRVWETYELHLHLAVGALGAFWKF